MALDTGGTTSPGPDTTAQFTKTSDNNYTYGISLPQYTNIPSVSGLYTGSLSAHGNMIAMQLNTGGFNYVQSGSDFEGNPTYTTTPYLTGYFREYWRNPSSCTFGSDSAIPAITGVIPSSVSGLQGNALYYMDLQLTRLSGSNFFDNYAFINNFNQIVNWVTTANRYLAALNNSENQNLEYFGFKTYEEFLSQGFSRYASGKALRAALGNIGYLAKEIRNGHFGSPNSVAKFMLDSGLGAIGDLAEKLIAAGVSFTNIYDELYTPEIKIVLESITNKGDLDIIQVVIGSTLPNMTSPMDYTSIEKCSGMANDSLFTSLQEFGLDIYQRAPNITVSTGQDLQAVIDLVLTQTPNAVESLATPTSLLPDAIINGLRQFLPVGRNNGPISILNAIGMASGYLLDQITEVNNGIEQLAKSKYGNPIRLALIDVGTTFNVYYTDLQSSRAQEENYFPPPPNPQLRINYENAVSNYYSLLNQAANDPLTLQIVDRINTNWLDLCENLYLEVVNYNKSGITASTYKDNTLIYSFVNSLPNYAADTQNIGTDYFLFGLCQSNQAGEIIKSILNQYKNNSVLSSSGVNIRGQV